MIWTFDTPLVRGRSDFDRRFRRASTADSADMRLPRRNERELSAPNEQRLQLEAVAALPRCARHMLPARRVN